MKNYLFYTAIFFSSAILLIFFLIFPNYQNLTFLKKEISQKEADLSAQEKYFQDIQNITEELKKYETAISKIDSALPAGLFLPELLNLIQVKASQSGLALKGIGPAAIVPAGEKGLKEIKVDLILIGNYSDFKNFLSILEKSARLIEIENISFSSLAEGPLTFNLTIKVYSY